MVAAVGVALLVVFARADDGSLARVEASRMLRWCGDLQGGEPYVSQDPTHPERLVGFEVEIAEAVAAELRVRARFVQNDWQMLVPALERGDCDLVLNGLEVMPSRVGRVRFTRPYYRFGVTLVVRQSDAGRVRSVGDLRGRRVGTLGGSLAETIVTSTPGVDRVLYEGVEEPYLDLAAGRIDGVVLDHVIAARYAAGKPGLTPVGEVGAGSYAIALRLTDESLAAAVDAALERLRERGTLRAILERWSLWDAHQSTITTSAASATPGARRLGWNDARLFMAGAAITIVISVLAMAIAVVGGLVLALAARYGGVVARGASRVYAEVFRGTPVLLQLYVLYYGLASIVSIDAFTAAVVGLGLNYAAYEAELYRAGLDAVPIAQTEAGLALGMSRWATVRYVVLPQALRIALPGVSNDFVALLKDTSLVSVITVVELTKQMTITAVDVRGWLVPGLLCAGLYLAMSLPLGMLTRRLERRLDAAGAA